MIRSLRQSLAGALALLSLPATLSAQTTVTLEDAMALARVGTPAARAMAAGVAAATARVAQARARFLPRVDVTESVQRGNEPVFVFSTLLSQRRFTPANFDVQNLNNPAAATNVRTAVTMTQPIYDASTALGVRAAELERDLVTVAQRQETQDLALAAARSFVQVLRLEAAERASAGAVAAAESDLERAKQRRDVGLVTDADVLALEVHLADVRQQQIATGGDLAVARLELTEALGLPLDQPVLLVRPTPATAPTDTALLTREALDARPERERAEIQVRLADNDRRRAESVFLPRVGIDAGWELNGSSWARQRSGWIVGARVELNVFNGLADRARVSEARQAETRTAAERERIERRIEVDVRGAVARVTTARAREAAGRAALTQARESQRIVRDRYDAGLTTITDVLRAAEAVFDAEARATAAEMDTILETVALNRAAGRL